MLLYFRKTLDELECVSRHIREIIDCRSLIGKKFKGTLTISQVSELVLFLKL